MSRFELAAYEPKKIQFELKAVFTLEQWTEVKDAIIAQEWHGPAAQLRDAIRDMVLQANKEYRAWPEEKKQ